MRVESIGWLGTRTASFDEMVAFAQETLGLRLGASEPGMAVFELPNGDLFEVFSPDHDGGGHPETGVVGGFLVDDVREAADVLRAAGHEVGDVQSGEAADWVYFRAPDGNVYELTNAAPGRGA